MDVVYIDATDKIIVYRLNTYSMYANDTNCNGFAKVAFKFKSYVIYVI